MPITPIGNQKNSFLCAKCKTRAQQLRKSLFYSCEHEDPPLPDHYEKYDASITICLNCNEETIWYNDVIIYPPNGNDIAPPNNYLPDDIKDDYHEASSIVTASPRGAISLLRLCIEKLCNYALNQEDGDEIKRGINSAIDELAKRDLITENIEKSLDIVRVTGNEAVHLGTMDLKDNVSVARSLFLLINECSEHMINRRNFINHQYDALPADKLEGINARKKKSAKQKHKAD